VLTLLAVAAASCSSKEDGAADATTAVTTADTEAAGAETTSPAASSDSTAAAPADTTAAAATDPLGEPNPATDTPIKIGYVSDGENVSFGSDEDQVKTFEATVKYANEYLGGLNGHEIQIEHCATENTPAGATQCAVDLTKAGVAAVLVAVSAQDGTLFEGFAGSGIPYFTHNSASSQILFGAGAFLITNPVSTIAVPALKAQELGMTKVGFIIIDVPAATGPITAIAQPIFDKLGIELQVIPISPSVADMTPQLQEALSGGADFFSVTGTDDFNISGVNGLRQLGFDGPILVGAPTQTVLDEFSSRDNLVGVGAVTDAADDPDVQLMGAIVSAYTDVAPVDADAGGFAVVIGFLRALAAAPDAVDAASITAALSTMPVADLPLGGGITFQCGTAPVSFAPSICSTDVLAWSYNDDGSRKDFGVVEVPGEILTLG
jgi:branched-chain amino acid transport system substrate-binding protein